MPGAREKAEDFVTEVLVGELSARFVVVGDDFHFGNHRRGNVALLRSMGEEAGFSVEPVPLVTDPWAHKIVSSTRIRRLIAKGELLEVSSSLLKSLMKFAVSWSPTAGPPRPARWPSEGTRSAWLVEVAGEILLPPAGRINAGLLRFPHHGDNPSEARLFVADRDAEGRQHVEVSGVELATPAEPILVGLSGRCAAGPLRLTTTPSGSEPNGVLGAGCSATPGPRKAKVAPWRSFRFGCSATPSCASARGGQ